MRALILLALAGCAPEVVDGAYYCGPEQLCPDDFVCDGATNICVTSGAQTDFVCGDTTEGEPNDSFATALDSGTFECASRVEANGCVENSEAQDYFSFTVPTTCSEPRKVVATVTYTVAFEPVVLEVVDGAGTVLATSEPCGISNDEDAGTTDACVEAPLTSGSQYAVRVVGQGSEDCGGACANNRYSVVIRLANQ